MFYPTVCSGADRRNQSSASLACVRGIQNSSHKGTITRKMFPFDDLIMKKTLQILLATMIYYRSLGKTWCVSRLKKIATFVFKLINNIGPDLTNNMFNEKHLPYSLCYNSKFIQSKPASTKYSINCIAYQGAVQWNKLPWDLNVCTNVVQFYSMLESWKSPSSSIGCVCCASFKIQCMSCGLLTSNSSSLCSISLWPLIPLLIVYISSFILVSSLSINSLMFLVTCQNCKFWQVCSFVGLSVCLSVLSSITHERFDISSPNLVHIWNGSAVPVCNIDK